MLMVALFAAMGDNQVQAVKLSKDANPDDTETDIYKPVTLTGW